MAAANFYVERTEESAEIARSQQARGMTKHATGTADKPEEEETDESEERERSQPVRKRVDQTTGEVNTISEVENGWGNKSAQTLAPRTMGIYVGDAATTAQQATVFVAGVNAPNAGTKSATCIGR